MKVGNGTSAYEDLPYVTAEVAAKILSTRNELSADIQGVRRETAERVDQLVAAWEGSELTDIEKLGSEIVDARTRYEGYAAMDDAGVAESGQSFDSVGDALRSIDRELQELRYISAGGFDTGRAAGAVRDYIDEQVSGVADQVSSLIGAKIPAGLTYEDNQLWLNDSNGEQIGEAVEIKGGSGGGGSSTSVRIVNLNGSSSISVAKDAPAILKFRFTSVEDGVPTGDGTCTILVDGESKVSYNIKQGDNEIDISAYLKVGTNSVKLTCTDQYGGSRSLAYVLTVIELSISSTFDASIPYKGNISFRYTPVGIAEKTTHFVIDGKEAATATTTSSNKQQIQNLAALPHGVHRLDVYVTAQLGDAEAVSNHLYYDVIAIQDGYDNAMIASVYTTEEIEQGEQISIPYIVYDPSKLSADITRRITYLKNGVETVYHEDTITVDRSQQYWNTRSYPVGTVTFTIIYDYNWNDTLGKYQGHAETSHTIKVSEPQIDIEPVTTGLAFHLSSKDRSNNELNPGQWSDGDVTTTFTNFNWKSNGWVEDENGDSCLRLNGDARAVVNYRLFGSNFKLSGKTIEFEFLVKDVNNRDAVVIDCYQGEIGLRITADTATFNSQNTQVKCNYKDNIRTRVSFVVEDSSDKNNRLVYVYLDGIMSGVQQYPTTDNFEQSEPVMISLGSSLCGLDLYNIRVYDTTLSSLQMVENYIADIPNVAEKVSAYNANDIYDEFSQLSYERIKTRIPVVTLIGDLPQYKGDKKKDTVKFKFEDPFHPELNFEDVISSIDVQGTSSQFYVRKNWKVKFKNKHQHMVGELPAKVFCLKVDYAEATGTHNTQAANLIETLYSEKIPPQKDNPKCRSTVEGFPVVIFEQATEDSAPKFASKGNFNYDKGADNIYGLSVDYDTESWEFCNNTSAVCNFTGNIDTSAKWSDDFEPRYVPPYQNSDGTLTEEPFDELDELEAKAADINVTMTDEEVARLKELRKALISRFKVVHDWVVSTKDDKDKFRKEFKDHFDMHFSLIYYVFTFFALMTDQRAKNMFLTYWNVDGTEDGGRWYPYFYDNDTIFGINNEGALVFDYYHEDTDKLGDSYVYNGWQSVLWNNFRECFSSEISEMYKTLRDTNQKLTYDTIINQFVKKGSDMWCENIYNEDADYKYISIIHTPDSTGKLWSTSQLYQVRGSGKQHLDYFIQNRLNYCDSKWSTGSYAKNMINVRIYTPVDDALVVPANPDITLTTFSDMYAGVRYKLNGTLLQKRMKKNETHTFEPPLQPDGTKEVFNDTETVVYGADQISSLGDLSGLYCGSLDVSAATRLVELIVGNHTEGYKNDNFRQISLGTNRLLKKLDLTNCSGLGVVGEQKSLSLLGCPNIEDIEAFGTSITSIELPESGYIRKLHLPKTINNLTIKNQLYIEDLQVESYENIATLCIDNCPTIDTTALLEKCKKDGQYTVGRVRLTGIDWSFDNLDFLRGLYGLKGIDEKGDNVDSIMLIGTCHITSLTGAEMKELNDKFPYLTITFGTLTAQLTFMDAYGNELVNAHQTIYNGGDGLEPVSNRMITAPTKTSSAKYDYEWSGWSTRSGEDEEPQEAAVLKVLADRVLYPTFNKTIRSYSVNFWNAGDEQPICTVVVQYGMSATYPEDVYGIPKKNTGSSDAFEFVGWAPSPSNITGVTNCYAQYKVQDGKWHECVQAELNPVFDAATKTATVSEWTGVATVIRINDTYDNEGEDYTITSIGDRSFQKEDIVLVDLPETLTNIGTRAFEGCDQLEAVTIPENVATVGGRAFNSCTALKSINYNAIKALTVSNTSEAPFDNAGVTDGLVVTIGSKVTQIPDYMFSQYSTRSSGSTSLAAIEQLVFEDDSQCTSIGKWAFWNANVKQAIQFPAKLRKIDQYAFRLNRFIETLTIPEGVEMVGREAFKDWTALKTINLPRTVVQIDSGAFAISPSLEEIMVDERNTNFRVKNQCLIRNRDMAVIAGNKNSVLPADIRSIEESAFEGCTGLTSVVIPEGVTLVPARAFASCSNLTSAIIPAQVTSIGASAFYACHLSKVALPESLAGTAIRTYAFAYNDLTDLVIPDGCQTIEDRAFAFNENLLKVDLGRGVETLKDGVFDGCLALKEVTLSEALKSASAVEGAEVFRNCSSLEVINAPFAEGTVLGAPWGAPSTVKINYNYVRGE